MKRDKFLLQKKKNKMSNKKRISDEEYESMMQQFEEDSQTRDFRDPFMDRIFQATLDNVMAENRKRRICRVASIAAGIVIISCAMLNCFTRVVYGESLMEIMKNSIKAGRFTITSISLGNQNYEFEYGDRIATWYEAETAEEIFEEIINDTEIEISELFCVAELPEKYEKWEAKYDKVLQRLMIHSRIDNDYFSICEELNYESAASSIILESQIVSSVFNENLQMNLDIIEQMDIIRCGGYCVEIFYEGKYLIIEGNGTLEEFEAIAKSIFIRERD